MREGTYLVMDAGGRPFAIPAGAVESLRSWENLRELPLGSAWLQGLLEGEGEVVPVLSNPWLGERGGGPREVVALVNAHGVRLAIPGDHPRLCAPDDEESLPEQASGPWTGTLRFGAESVACLDPEKLYLELGLH